MATMGASAQRKGSPVTIAQIGSLFELYPSRSDELQHAIDAVASEGAEERGAIYTRREVVELILDLAGYRSDADLVSFRFLEPSFGRGDFLLVAISRLLDAHLRAGGTKSNCGVALQDAIRAVELHRETFVATRERVRQLLHQRGVPPDAAARLLSSWLIQDDFLLCDLPFEFTHVVGNPPYVRLERIPETLLHAYRARYVTMYDRADLYVPFIERGLGLLGQAGKLAYICSDRWLKNRYGGPLRRIIAKDFHLQHYIDMTGVDAFHSAVTAYPAIIVVAAGKGTTTRVVQKLDLTTTTLQELAEKLRVSEQDDNPIGQDFEGVSSGAHPLVLSVTDSEQRVLRRLEHDFPPLETVGCKVGIGAATGCDRVYIGPFDTLPVEDDRKVPLVRTHDIQSGVVRWSGNAILDTFTPAGDLIPLADYPLLAKYLAQHEETLRARHIAKRSPPHAWYRTIDRLHPGLTACPKLLIPDIKADAHVVYDEGHYYPHHNLYYVTSSTWDLRALQAVLRSQVARLFVAAYSIRMRAGYLRFQAQYLRHIHLPAWEMIPAELRLRLRDAAEAGDVPAMNDATCDAYQLGAAGRTVLLKGRTSGLA